MLSLLCVALSKRFQEKMRLAGEVGVKITAKHEKNRRKLLGEVKMTVCFLYFPVDLI